MIDCRRYEIKLDRAHGAASPVDSAVRMTGTQARLSMLQTGMKARTGVDHHSIESIEPLQLSAGGGAPVPEAMLNMKTSILAALGAKLERRHRLCRLCLKQGKRERAVAGDVDSWE